jgi:hypothetical protein
LNSSLPEAFHEPGSIGAKGSIPISKVAVYLSQKTPFLRVKETARTAMLQTDPRREGE